MNETPRHAPAEEAGTSDSHECKVCGYRTDHPAASELGEVRGNTSRFKARLFHLWQCPHCLSIHSIDPVSFSDIYSGYPLGKRRLDVFARGTFNNLLGRLKRAGVTKATSVLDFGSGEGIFVDFLREKNFGDVVAYDPYVEKHARPINRQFDCVIANDVIEHVPDPRAMVAECIDLLKPGGVLYLGTADSEPVVMNDLDAHLMRLHQPFHRVVLTAASLMNIGVEAGLKPVRAYRRSYMDTLMPFCNYRFLDEFNRALGHEMDRAFDPAAGKVVMRKPVMWFWAFFGYLFPSAYEPAVVFRK